MLGLADMRKLIIIIIVIILAMVIIVVPPAEVSGTPKPNGGGQTNGANADDPDPSSPVSGYKLSSAIVDTIAELETAGARTCDVVGQSGERGCFQFMPSTWKAYSIEVLGYEVTHTPENERAVVEGKVSRWLAQGLSPSQIFLMWNQGNIRECKSGVNSHGVRFDSCAYVSKALGILKHTYGDTD